MPSHAESARALVTGGRGVVGAYLLPRLAGAGFEVLAISRRPRGSDRAARRGHVGAPGGAPLEEAPDGDADGSVRWVTLELGRGSLPDGTFPLLLHAAPIWLLPPLLESLASRGLRRLVAFSSTSRISKEQSPNPHERALACRLAQAEDATAELCGRYDVAWTIFRPTLIYGGGLDRNVSDIARTVRCTGVFPLVGSGRGLRQPVHADDLAQACLAVLENPATFGRAYELPGGETITYAEMVQRIAAGLRRNVWTPRVPPGLLRAALSVASRLPRLGHLTPEMADRMNQDLAFDGSAARRDFGYAPRPFRYLASEALPRA